MKIELNKHYITERGNVVRPVVFEDGAFTCFYEYKADNTIRKTSAQWHEDGSFAWKPGYDDIIKEDK